MYKLYAQFYWMGDYLSPIINSCIYMKERHVRASFNLNDLVPSLAIHTNNVCFLLLF